MKQPVQNRVLPRLINYVTFSPYRVTRGMLHDDRIIFGLLLSKIYLRNKLDLDPEFNYLIRGQDLDPRDKVQAAIDSLRDRFAYFKDLNPSLSHDSDFAAWMTSPTPEDQVTETFTKFVYIFCLHLLSLFTYFVYIIRCQNFGMRKINMKRLKA